MATNLRIDWSNLNNEGFYKDIANIWSITPLGCTKVAVIIWTRFLTLLLATPGTLRTAIMIFIEEVISQGFGSTVTKRRKNMSNCTKMLFHMGELLSSVIQLIYVDTLFSRRTIPSVGRFFLLFKPFNKGRKRYWLWCCLTDHRKQDHVECKIM